MSLKIKRRYTRFSSEVNTLACLNLSGVGTDYKKFKVELIGLTVEESHGGCAVICYTNTPFIINQKVVVKVGDLAPLLSEVRWIKQLDPNIYKIGFKFLE